MKRNSLTNAIAHALYNKGDESTFATWNLQGDVLLYPYYTSRTVSQEVIEPEYVPILDFYRMR